MVLKCCVALCRNNASTPNVSLHNFTKDPKLMKIWIHKIKRDTVKSRRNPRPFSVSKWTKICSDHFKKDDFILRSERRILRNSAIPTIFEWTQQHKLLRISSLQCDTDNKTSESTETPKNIVSQGDLASENYVVGSPSEEIYQPHSREPYDGNLNIQLKMSNCDTVLNEEIEGRSKTPTNEELSPCPSSESINHTEGVDYKTLLTLYTDLLREQQDFLESCTCRNVVTENKSTYVDFVVEESACSSIRFSLNHFKHNDSAIQYYTGFTSYQMLEISLKMLFDYSDSDVVNFNANSTSSCNNRNRQRTLSRENEYFLVLIKLRQNYGYQHLAHLFNVSVSTACNIFISWINFMYVRLCSIDIWAHRDVILAEASDEFRQNYPNVIGFLDATEIYIQTPSSLLIQSQTYSQYKHSNTAKGLVVVDCNGSVIFVSSLFTGGISDNSLLQKSCFTKVVEHKLGKSFLLPGDTFLADKGFTSTELLKPIEINIPVFRINNRQFSVNEVFQTQKIAHERIHVERTIGRLKNYKILSSEVPLSLLGTFKFGLYVVCFQTSKIL